VTENFDPVAYNRAAWDREVDRGNEWTRPVGPDVIARARAGDWSVGTAVLGLFATRAVKPGPRDHPGNMASTSGSDRTTLVSAAGAFPSGTPRMICTARTPAATLPAQ
jgi:hypothetical protein